MTLISKDSSIVVKSEIVNTIREYLELMNQRIEPLVYLLFLIIDSGQEEIIKEELEKAKRMVQERKEIEKAHQDILREKEELRTEKMRVFNKEKEIEVEVQKKGEEAIKREREELERMFNSAVAQKEAEYRERERKIQMKEAEKYQIRSIDTLNVSDEENSSALYVLIPPFVILVPIKLLSGIFFSFLFGN